MPTFVEVDHDPFAPKTDSPGTPSAASAGGWPQISAAYAADKPARDAAQLSILQNERAEETNPQNMPIRDREIARVQQTAAPAATPPPARTGPTFVEVDHDPFAPAVEKSAAPEPADNSFLSNLGSGAGVALTNLALGAKQRWDDGAAALENTFGGQKVNQALGLSNAADIQKQTQSDVDRKRIADAPTMQTTGGKIGNFLGNAAPAVVAAMIPGGQGLAGSMITGGILGGAQTTSGDESVAGNVIGGVAGGALGYGVGKGVSALAGKVRDSASAKAALNVPKDTIAATARDAGYAIPPMQTSPGILNGILEGFAGKVSTAQKASVKNQAVTNRLAAQELGLDPAQPITKDALNGIRRTAGQAYDAVGSTGQITPTAAYTQALDDIARPYVQAAQGFPSAPAHPVLAQIDALRSPTFDAASAVAKIKSLRAQADTAYRGGDKEIGGALKSGANALEDVIDTHLASTGAPANLLSNFRDARQTIAKTYSVEKALNDSTGNVNAGKLASQLARDKPLSGELKTIAQVGRAFPEAAKEVTSSMPGVSPLDFHGASLISMLGHGLLGAATAGTSLVARPLIRAGILSKAFQNSAAVPSYGGNAVLNGLGSAPGRAALQGAGPEGIRRLIGEQQPGYADGGLLGDEPENDAEAYNKQALNLIEYNQKQDKYTQDKAAAVRRENEVGGLQSMGEDPSEWGYKNGGMLGAPHMTAPIRALAFAKSGGRPH